MIYVLSSDKKQLIKLSKAVIQKNITANKDQKFVITISTDHIGMEMVAGYYATEEEAIVELGRLYQAIGEGRTVYEMN